MTRRLVLLVSLLASACSDAPPTGQVLARVNGEDVTRRDLLVELAPDGVASSADDWDHRAQLLKHVIARRLLVEEAKRQNIDKSPEYLGQMRRMREILLVNLLRQRLAGRLPPPSRAEIERIIAQEGPLFDNRLVHSVDQIIVYGPLDVRAIAAFPSNSKVARWFDTHAIPYERSETIVDSIDPGGKQLQSRPTTPVIIRTGRIWMIRQIIKTWLQPVPPTEREAVAENKARSLVEQANFNELYVVLKQRATIDYQKDLNVQDNAE